MIDPHYGTPLLIQDNQIHTLSRTPMGSTSSSGYDENYVRNLAFDHPSCLPIAEIDLAYKNPVPICKELNTLAGPIDALYITPEGRIIILEAKLWRNPEARRKVVGQILDYAKELCRWDYEDLQREISRNTSIKGNAPYEIVKSASPELSEAAFVDSVSKSLRQGRFLLMILGDGIREGAASIADFIQRVGSLEFTFGLVELAFYHSEATGTLVQPRVIAKTEIIQRSVISIRDHKIEVRDEEAEETSEKNTEDKLSGSQKWYATFWPEVLNGLVLDDPEQPMANPTRRGNIFFKMPPGTGGTEAWLTVYCLQNHNRCGVFLKFRKGSLADRLYSSLLEESDEIEKEIGQPLEWEELGDSEYMICLAKSFPGLRSPEHQEEVIAFLRDTINRFVNTFRPRLKRLTEEH